MKLKIPNYNIPNSKEKVSEITINLINYAINSKYPNGIDGQYRRIFGRLQSRFDEAISKDLKIIELETAEIELISNALKDGKIPSLFAKYVIMLEDAVGNAIEEKK